MTVTLREFMSWDLCPSAAKAGALFVDPTGNRVLAQRVCRSWPKETSPLSSMMPTTKGNRQRAHEWMASTLFGQKRIVQADGIGGLTLPKTVSGHWHGHEGVLRVGADTFLFSIDWAYLVGTTWEIVLLDTNVLPPDRYRSAGILAQAAYVSGAFTEMTGEQTQVRLIAPGYEHEELVRVPYHDFGSLVATYPAMSKIRRIRPGLHCYEREGGVIDAKWTCLLRRSGVCSPANPLGSM